MITISKRLFCLILVGLASLATASICSIMQLPMHQAVILFLGTWLVLMTLFESESFIGHKTGFSEPPPRQK